MHEIKVKTLSQASCIQKGPKDISPYSTYLSSARKENASSTTFLFYYCFDQGNFVPGSQFWPFFQVWSRHHYHIPDLIIKIIHVSEKRNPLDKCEEEEVSISSSDSFHRQRMAKSKFYKIKKKIHNFRQYDRPRLDSLMVFKYKATIDAIWVQWELSEKWKIFFISQNCLKKCMKFSLYLGRKNRDHFWILIEQSIESYSIVRINSVIERIKVGKIIFWS